jgi:hypothetical protein
MMITVALVAWMVLVGCTAPPSIGGACDLGTPPPDGRTTTISSSALECEGRTCIQMNGGQPRCSAECSQADDCREVTPGATSCRGGFTCAVAVRAGDFPGSFACHHFCVCRDDVDSSQISCPATN